MNKWKDKFGPFGGYIVIFTCIMAQAVYVLKFAENLASEKGLILSIFNDSFGGAIGWLLVILFNAGYYDYRQSSDSE